MRLKIIVPALLVGLVICGVAWFFAPKKDAAAPSLSVTVADSPKVTVAPQTAAAPTPENQVIALKAIEPSEAEKQAKSEYVQTRIAELNDLAMTDDPASLTQILRELDNPDPEIRGAAVDAAVQFKSPDAIPALKSALDQAPDLDEKVNIQKAIDFLNLTFPQTATNSSP